MPRSALSSTAMGARKLIFAIGLVGVLGAGSAAHAQWIRLQRCNGALPCAIPFGVRYNPDPLIASQYGFVSPNGVSARFAFEAGGPVLHFDQPHVELQGPDFAAEAARRFLLAHPAPAEKQATPRKVEPAPKPSPPPD